MTERVVKVYPKQEQLEDIVQGFNKALVHVQYLLANHHESFIDKSSLRALQNDLQVQIHKLEKLYKTKA
ncbi:hypothetical protein F895_01997 [Acinetobacter sp. CIP 64.2]|uniref:hypothetical protein n=1 Tax=unclassified Acinetobacter TaxID=196816 RepID=UPI000288F1D2|nr:MULTISPECIES: hypothetical protein [unclassified Acinetobacter]ENX15451.1 hypothetical protein F895_01997 [Acinetobacter sp. CIP 64.2]